MEQSFSEIMISIHALHEEGDIGYILTLDTTNTISIHALHEEGDHGREYVRHFWPNFYPRPP